jgi:hypothetical protein
MKQDRLLVVFVVFGLAGCQPTYISGKTQCSDKKECPSGFTCFDDGTTAIHYCFDNLPGAGGIKGAGGSMVTGGSKDAGVLPGGSGGIKVPPVGAGGAFGLGGAIGMGGTIGAGGIKTTLVGAGGTAGGDAGVIRDASVIRDVFTAATPDVAGRDAGAGCAIPCPLGQQCLSGQCCVPPAAGGDCTAFPVCGCSAAKVCYPSSTTHAMACFAANYIAAGADCTGGSTCQAGSGCFGGLCKRYCLTNSDCTSVGGVQSCEQTTWSSDKTSILGVLVCERICDPVHPQSPTAPLLACPIGFNCSSDTAGASYCLKASPLPVGSICASESDCPAGYYCSSTSGLCNRYCMSDRDCVVPATCQLTWSPSEYAGSYMVGYCK